MGKKLKLTVDALLAEYYNKLNHPLAQVVEALRQIVLSSGMEIGEQIKWNSPSFFYTGEMAPFDPKEYRRDIVVFNLHKADCVLLVFPTGSGINDPSGLLEGNFRDSRKVARFTSMRHVVKREKDLQQVIKKWLNSVERA